jgi:threonine dehydrogenase-like Zn-dependent dehydrogenase
MTFEELVATLQDTARPLEVVGDGPLAHQLRERLGDDADDAPATIVETTGTDAALASALTRVAKLGTVVLVGPPPVEDPALDLYVDAHARGLTIIGVAPPELPDLPDEAPSR